MEALICTEPGSFEYKDIEAPVLKPGHAIIKIRRIGICGTDLHAYTGTQPYFTYPRILGHELAADLIEADGVMDLCRARRLQSCLILIVENVLPAEMENLIVALILRFVVYMLMVPCELYLSVPSYSLIKSEGLSYDELALTEPLAIGAHGIRRGNVQKDEFVLVIGAGPIGLGTMMFAKIAGAKVIALDINDQRLQFCKDQLHTQYIINASKEDVSARLREITNCDMPTVVIDATGNQKAINNALQYLAHGGRFILIGLQKEEICFSHPEFHKRETTLMSSRNATREDFIHVINSIKSGLINPSILITHRVKFNEVKDAFPGWSDPKTNVIKAMVEM